MSCCFEVALGYSCIVALPSLFSHFATSMPCCTPLLHVVLLVSRLVAHDSLLTLCYPAIVPCCPTIVSCYSALLVVGPCYLTIAPNYSPFSSIFCPPPPPSPPLLLCCLDVHCRALIFYLVNWYSFLTLLCRWRSLEQHQQASSNNRGIFFQIS
jgi:hypothetical protein